MYNIPFFAFFALILVFSLGEFLLSSMWMPFFFRFGIPIYRQEFRLMNSLGSLDVHIAELEEQLPRTWQRSAIAFRALSSNELAFRQKFGQRRNQTYGLLAYEPQRQVLTFKGYLPFSVLIFPVFFLIFLLMGPFPYPALFLLFLLLMIGFSVVYQYRSYGRIAQAIQHIFQKEITTDEIVTLPEYQPYDPFTTPSSTQSQLPVNTILMVVLLGLMALLALVFVFLFLP